MNIPSILEMVNIPPSPRLALVPLLLPVIVCLLSYCLHFLSVYLSVHFIQFCPCLLQKCTHDYIQRQFPFKFAAEHIQQSVKDTVQYIGWPDRQTCFLPVQGIAFTLWVTLLAYARYAHVANASFCFGPCLPAHTFRVLLNVWTIWLELQWTLAIFCS